MRTLSPALKGLEQYHQFILYKVDGSAKRPVNPVTMEVTDAHDPSIWTDYSTAKLQADAFGQGWGVNFVLTKKDPFWFVDIDHCLQADRSWSQLAVDLCQRLAGAAIEISVSGTGLHIIGTGTIPQHGCKNTALGIELYTEKRTISLTDNATVGNCMSDLTVAMGSIVEQFFPFKQAAGSEGWRTEAVPEWSGPENDEELIAKARSSRSAASAFTRKASFDDLWTGNIQSLGAAYPSLNDHDPYDRSSADAALAQHLAFWTGKNHERIHRLMWQSALVRDKWTTHKNYLAQMTIMHAVGNQREVYKDRSVKSESVEPSPTNRETAQLTTGHQFMGVSSLVEYFKDCIYVRDLHRVFVPDGSLLKPEQFKAFYSGYEFTLNSDNSKTTRNAWEALTDNQAVRFPRVSNVCFKPYDTGNRITESEGLMTLNTYTPIVTERKTGDVSPFLDFLYRLLPNERDRSILLSYMASLIQNPGVKFQWAPLIQGAEGNGKTLLSRAMAYAVGHRYTHFPNAADLGNVFNAWMFGKLLIVVEEIFAADKTEVLEPMKVWIANDRVEIQRKGVDQTTGDNYANWILGTNHKTAIPTNYDSRRYCIFYTAQQSFQDIISSGMSGAYFPNLYKWAKSGGYAIINDYLRTYVPAVEFDPAAGCQRAPQTSSTEEAVFLSLGRVEQEIVEELNQGAPGFADGWVSSIALNNLLVRIRAEVKIPRNKRKELMNRLGYQHHPALQGGRTNSIVPAEGGKPTLFVKQGHLSCNLVSPSDVLKAYMKAQGYPVGISNAAGY